MNYVCDWTSVIYISGMICIKICVKEVRVFLMFADICISWFEVTLVGAFFSFIFFLSLVYDGFMWMLHEVFHTMFESNKSRFCWCIHISSDSYCKILMIIASLDSDVHESTNPVIYWSSMWFLNLFQLFSNERCSHEECIFRVCIHYKWWLLKFYLILCFYYPIFLNNIFMVWSVWSILMP